MFSIPSSVSASYPQEIKKTTLVDFEKGHHYYCRLETLRVLTIDRGLLYFDCCWVSSSTVLYHDHELAQTGLHQFFFRHFVVQTQCLAHLVL